MRPTLEPGDRLLVRPVRRLRVGQLVVVADPRDGRLLVKRVAAIDERGITVLGDQPERSTDSRAFGAVPRSAIRGRVFRRYWPLDRGGRL